MEPEQLARRFHETYERLAPMYHYATRRESAVAWEDVPEANRALMVATVTEVFGRDEQEPALPQVVFAPDGALSGIRVQPPLHEWRCPSCGATTRARMADERDQPLLGLATNRELLEELSVRIEVHGPGLDYRTVDS